MRIAHCSDLHLLSLAGASWLDFANKRWIGGLNLLGNRGRHYHAEVFEAMIEDINARAFDHVICTGDVTNLAFEQEFRFARTLFERFDLSPRHVTVIPGNHDAYVSEGVRNFCEIFGDYCDADVGWDDERRWPTVRVRGSVAIIGLSTSLQTPWFTAYGRVGADQLERLHRVLVDERIADKLRLVAIHHPPAGKVSHNRIRGLRDVAAFTEVIAEAGAELILHGHEHRDMRNTLSGPDQSPVDVLGVQSGTYEANRPERTARYRLIEVADTARPGAARPHVVRHELRKWSRQRAAFVADPAPPGPHPDDVGAPQAARPHGTPASR